MVVTAPLQARKDAAVDSPLCGPNHKLAVGSLVRVGATEVLTTRPRGKPMTEHRMLIELDGDSEALGWVSGVSKQEEVNLQLAVSGFPLLKTVRRVIYRSGKEADAQKVGDFPKDTLLRLMESCDTPDGLKKALMSREGMVAKPLGWVTMGKVRGTVPGEADNEEVALIPAPLLSINFDLKVHTATSLTRVLASNAKVSAKKLRKLARRSTLPVQAALKRPSVQPDSGPEQSRHLLVKDPSALKLAFNCFNAAFEVTDWTNHRLGQNCIRPNLST